MKDLTISTGQPGRLVFNLTGGAASLTPVGWIAVTEYPGAKPVPTQMQWVAADNALYLPPMPFGCFFYEVRVGALEVAKGHIEVTPSPFPYDGQEYKTWVVTDGDLVNDVATFNIDAALGLPGPQGEKGEKGDTGATGPQGEKGEQGAPLTYADLTGTQRAELVEPLVYSATTMQPAGSQEDNFDSYGFVCVATQGGIITGLELACRVGGTARPTNTPVYVKIWRGSTELLARSDNACQHALAATLSYTFEPFTVTAGEELRVTYHTADGITTTAYQMGTQCCQRAVALATGETGGMLDSNGNFSNTAWTAKYTWHMLTARFAPAAHASDTTVHITALEHAGLSELLARKDALLALLNNPDS